MMTGITPVTVTFLAQEIRRRAARQIPKGQRVLVPGCRSLEREPYRPARPGNEEPAGERLLDACAPKSRIDLGLEFDPCKQVRAGDLNMLQYFALTEKGPSLAWHGVDAGHGTLASNGTR